MFADAPPNAGGSKTPQPPRRQDMPVKVLNGSPSYMNLLDALNAWQLSRELAESLQLPAAASFHNVAPTGAAIAVPLSKSEVLQCQVEDLLPLKDLATAYARCRERRRRGFLTEQSMDRAGLCDIVSLSANCDLQTAKIISRDVSEGVIAPDFEPAALELLCKKKQGLYIVLKIDPTYRAAEDEDRSVFGLKLRQKFADTEIRPALFQDNLITDQKKVSEVGLRDLTVATITLKYAPSHTLCYAKAGQIIGIGMTRDDLTNTTGTVKAAHWWLRHHPRLLRFPFRPTVKKSERAAVLDLFLASETRDDFLASVDNPDKLFEKEPPKLLTKEERDGWQDKLKEVALSSDAFYPFPLNIDQLLGGLVFFEVGVEWIAVSGAHRASDETLAALCGERGISLSHTGLTNAIS